MEKKFQTLEIDGTSYTTLFTKKYEKRKTWEQKEENCVRTVIPGTVISIKVKEGDKVNAGDVVLVYEAMKMQNLIRAPHNGKIVSISVKEGDKLPKGAEMMQIFGQ